MSFQKNFFFIFIVICISLSLYSYEGDGKSDIMVNCNTKYYFHSYENPALSKTIITMYGDSRMDFVNFPGYGDSTMAKIFNIPADGYPPYSPDQLFEDDNIQNFLLTKISKMINRGIR
jgi:hypothetical protein